MYDQVDWELLKYIMDALDFKYIDVDNIDIYSSDIDSVLRDFNYSSEFDIDNETQDRLLKVPIKDLTELHERLQGQFRRSMPIVLRYKVGLMYYQLHKYCNVSFFKNSYEETIRRRGYLKKIN